MLTDLVNQYSSSRIELRLYATPATPTTPTYGGGARAKLKARAVKGLKASSRAI